MQSKCFYSGFTARARAEWRQYALAPTAPSNYKDPVKIAQYVDDATAKQELLVQRTPLLARLTSVVLLDAGGNAVFQRAAADNLVNPVAVPLAKFLMDEFPDGLEQQPGGMGSPLIGFDAKTLLRLMAFDIFSYNRTNPADAVQLPINLWYSTAAVDPYEALIRGDDRKDLDLGSLCDFFGLTMTDDIADNPTRQAGLARELSSAAFFDLVTVEV